MHHNKHHGFPVVDPKVYRSTMGLFATGVTVITYKLGAEDTGMTANAFMSVSLDPPLIMVSVRKVSRFCEHMPVGSFYGVNFLAEEQQDVSNHFGGRPMDGISIPYVYREGVPLIEGSLAHITAQVVDVHEAGDHLLYIARVHHLKHGQQRKPLIYFSGKYKNVSTHAHLAGWTAAVDGW